MIKLEIEEFIFEVKDEILSYEEFGQKTANIWEEKFLNLIKNKQKNIKNIKFQDGKTYYLLDDESDIFDIADKYIYAIEQNKENEYWENF